MLKKQGFDEWSKQYDEYVKKSKGYPFEGYNELMNEIVNQINFEEYPSILDVGIGTGTLSSLLESSGARITGIDFSNEMIKIANSRIKDGIFYAHDLTQGLPEVIKKEKYDYIISTYVIHHFKTEKKVELIKEMSSLLNPGGMILIGDVSFLTQGKLEECKQDNLIKWDDDELYMVASEIMEALDEAGINSIYKQISSCAGILVIS